MFFLKNVAWFNKKKIESMSFEQHIDTMPNEKDVSVDIHHTSDLTHWHFWIIGLVVVASWWFLYSIFNRVLLVFTGVVISIAMESLIEYLTRKTWKRRLWMLLAYLFLIWLLLSGVLVMIPFLINQLSDLVTIVISWAQSIEWLLKANTLESTIRSMSLYGYLQSFWIDLTEPKYLEYLQSLLQNNISAILSFWSGYAKDAGQIVVNTVWSLISTLTQIGFVLTLSILLGIEKNWFVAFVYKLSGESKVARDKITLLYKKLWFRLKTQIMLGLYIGIVMRLSLLILSLFWFDIPNKWSLATIAALTELIPYLWPLIGGIPVVLLYSLSYWFSWFMIGWLLVFCVQRIENNVLIPLLFKQNLWVSPVVIFLCMVLWWITIWINGVILAIPIAVIITILFTDSK